MQTRYQEGIVFQAGVPSSPAKPPAQRLLNSRHQICFVVSDVCREGAVELLAIDPEIAFVVRFDGSRPGEGGPCLLSDCQALPFIEPERRDVYKSFHLRACRLPRR